MQDLLRSCQIASFWNVLPWYSVTIFWMLAISALAAGGFLLFRRLANPHVLKKNQEIASYALNAIALLYCVIVGFVVIRVQDRNSSLKDTVAKEANLLLNLYYSSCDVFAPDVCDRIRASICTYTNDVITKEWPLMVEGKDITLAFPKSMHKLWIVYDNITPEGAGQKARYNEAMYRLNKLSEARFIRLSNVGRSEGLFMWSVLIYGGILVIVSSYLFASTSIVEHLAQLIFITSFTVLVLLLIYSLDTPYMGPTAITPMPFEHVLELIDIKHRAG